MDSEFENKITDLKTLYPRKSLKSYDMIIRVKKGHDDIVGNAIQEKIFNKRKFIQYKNYRDFIREIELFINPWKLEVILYSS